MPFTSSSTNKSNKFRLPAGKAKILVCVGEYALYTITQKTPLLIPVYAPKQNHHPKAFRAQPYRRECLDMARILATCTKTSKHSLILSLPTKPHKIISCKLTKPTVTKKHIPQQHKNSAIAIINFHYELELTYTDISGNFHTISCDSGWRRQRVTLNTPLGHLDVQLYLKCFAREIFTAEQKDLNHDDKFQHERPFQPVRFTLKART